MKNVDESKLNTSFGIYMESVLAGERACVADKPVPMYVEQHKNMADDNSPIEVVYEVSDGMCGFAEVKISFKTPANRKFINDLKKQGLVGEGHNCPIHKAYGGGFSYWIRQGRQSISRKEAFGQAMSEVLNHAGIKAYMISRLD